MVFLASADPLQDLGHRNEELRSLFLAVSLAQRPLLSPSARFENKKDATLHTVVFENVKRQHGVLFENHSTTFLDKISQSSCINNREYLLSVS